STVFDCGRLIAAAEALRESKPLPDRPWVDEGIEQDEEITLEAPAEAEPSLLAEPDSASIAEPDPAPVVEPDPAPVVEPDAAPVAESVSGQDVGGESEFLAQGAFHIEFEPVVDEAVEPLIEVEFDPRGELEAE